LRGKLLQIANNFLTLAKLLRDEIHNEILLKTIYVQKMYPSPDFSLLQILYSDSLFYKELLATETVSSIVNGLWIFKNYYTYNFLITSTAFKNLKGDLIFRESLNNGLNRKLNNSSGLKSYDDLSTYNNKEENEVFKFLKMQEMDFKEPFSFINKTNTFDYKFTNHIFSFAFWAKSPAYKVFLEAMIYVLFFFVIFQNLSQIFKIRRIFQSFPNEILVLIDGFVGLLYGYPVTSELLESIQPWMIANNVTDPKIAFYYASKQTTRCGVMLMFVPEFEPQCSLYEFAATNIWSVMDNFFIFQYFFYFTFLGSIFEFIYAMILTKKIKITLKMILDLIITGANIFVQYIYYQKVYNHHAIIRDNMLVTYNEIEKTMLFYIFLMWIKFLEYLKLTKNFGYIIKIIEIMIKKLIGFMIIFAIIVLAFALLSYDLLDKSNDRFGSFEMSIRTLMEIAYGQVFFNGFSSNETLAVFIITIFSIITMVIMLNLLVAILSNTYQTINERSTVETASILYENYLIRKPDKCHSALIALPPPFNILTVLFSPFLILSKNHKLNKFLLLIGYSFYLIPCFIIFVCINLLVVIPFCWIKYIIFILINVVFKQRSLRSIIFWFSWIVGGLLKLFYLFFTNDIICFTKSIFHYSTNRDKMDEISFKEIKLIKQKACRLLEKGESTTYKELCESIRNELESLNRNISAENGDSFFGLEAENLSKKYVLSKMFQGYSSSLYPDKRNANKVKNLLKELEIDKMEVFSLIKQFEGVNGKIMLPRLIGVLDMLKYCKKFSMLKLNQKQEEKVVNNIQIVDVLAAEKVVLGILSGNLKSLELQQEFIKRINLSEDWKKDKRFDFNEEN